jgi:hypothetical protein
MDGPLAIQSYGKGWFLAVESPILCENSGDGFMKTFIWVPVCAMVLLAACDDMGGANSAASAGFMSEIPEGVLAIAAPYQDLTAVRIDRATGCYLYSHAGPVETTLLPLRTADGRPICTGPVVEPTAS